MIKNYLKLTFKLLKRKKIFSGITIFGMAVPLMFLMIITASLYHFTAHKPPESNFDRVVFLNQLKFSLKREKRMSGNMRGKPSYDFIKKYVKPMKTPEKVGVASQPETYNLYVKDKKSRLNVVYTDAAFWEIADFKFTEGKAFNISDVKNSQLVAVIDEHTKKLVFGNEYAVGKIMKFFKKSYKIIGVVEDVDISRQNTYANVWLPITTSEKYMTDDIFAAGCNCMLLAGTREQIPLIKEEFSHIIENFDLGNYDGLTEIDGELTGITFNDKLKSILNNLFSINVKENYIIYLVYAVIFFFFILLPSINLLYIHSSRINERSSEIGVRKSFGGAKQILSGQFIFENVTVSLLSGILGLIFTLLFFWVFNSTRIVPGLHLSINLVSLLICFALWLIFGVSTGLIPAIRMSKVKIIDALNRNEIHANITILTRRIKRLKIILVIEFALTFLSLAAISTYIFRFQKNNSYPLGFDCHNVYQVSVIQYDKQQTDWFGGGLGNEEIVKLIKSASHVEYYGKWQWNEPYHEGYTTVMDGIKYKERNIKDDVHISIVDENMDKVFSIKVIEGRWFNAADDRPDYYPVVLNQQCKKQLFGNEKALGEYVEIRNNKCQVIGVIDYYKYHGEFSTPVDIVFTNVFLNDLSINMSGRQTTDYFRVKPGTSLEDINSMAAMLSQKYPGYEINITSLDSVRSKYLRKTLGPVVVVLAVFFLIMIVVLLGLFGVLWYDISLRKSEVGVRRAAGATSGKIFSLVVKEMLLWASLGIIIGIALFVQLPFLNLFSFGWSNGVGSVIFAALIIYILVIICSLLPASQAAKIQPAVALHEE